MINNKEEFKAYIDRLVPLDQEKKDVSDSFREVVAEAKAKGYDPKALRRVVRDLRKDPNSVREENENYELYAHAAGIVLE